MAHLPLREPDNDLLPLVRTGSNEDLGILIGYLHKAYNEDISSVPAFQEQNPRASEKVYEGNHRMYADDIAAEVQRYGGNSLSNIFRGGKGVAYASVVRDVADQLKVSYNSNASVETIEHQIQLKVLEKAYEEMSDTEKEDLLRELGIKTASIPKALPLAAIQGAVRMAGFASYKLALIVANAIAKAVLGRGLAFAANATLTKSISAFAGPIGWAITAVWTLVDLTGPAYRITIPCVLHVAYMRQKTLVIPCTACGEPQPLTTKFCSSCGAPVARSA